MSFFSASSRCGKFTGRLGFHLGFCCFGSFPWLDPCWVSVCFTSWPTLNGRSILKARKRSHLGRALWRRRAESVKWRRIMARIDPRGDQRVVLPHTLSRSRTFTAVHPPPRRPRLDAALVDRFRSNDEDGQAVDGLRPSRPYPNLTSLVDCWSGAWCWTHPYERRVRAADRERCMKLGSQERITGIDDGS